MQIATIGLDLAKTIFQVHGVDAAGGVVIRRRLRTIALLGHEVRLMPPAEVKP